MPTETEMIMVRGGMGTVPAVCDAWIAEMAEHKTNVEQIHDLRGILIDLLAEERTSQAAFGIACAVLNKFYGQTGMMFGCVDGEPPTCLLHEEQFTRDVFVNGWFKDQIK